MSEQRLRELLAGVEVPAAAAAERRGRAVVEAAFAERLAAGAPRRSRPARLPRLAIGVALATLVAALLLSPAGAAVRDWVGEVFDGGGTGLREIPGGGRLLVQSEGGPWVVAADGSRRLLGNYEEATWSPHGLFLAVVSGRTLTAVEPNGTPRWSLTAARPVRGPRWSPSGYEIAYRSGSSLRVTGADNTGDRRIAARVAAVSPAWSPLRAPQLAYLGADGRLRIAASANGEVLAMAPALPALAAIEWSELDAGYGLLLEVGAAALRVRQTVVGKLAGATILGPPRRLALPGGAVELRDAALSPDGRAVAALVLVDGPRGARSAVRLIDTRDGTSHRLYSVAGDGLAELAWSPDGSHLLVAAPRRDEWLFLRRGPHEGRSFDGIAAAFSPGRVANAFPTVEGWCCREAGG
ncbi:MAG: hypothetical protein R2725_13825 [Solirubrobacterales bacterium]